MHFRLSCRHQCTLPSHRRGNFTVNPWGSLTHLLHQATARNLCSDFFLFLASWIILPLMDFHMSGIIQHLLFVSGFFLWGLSVLLRDSAPWFFAYCSVALHCVIPVSSSLLLWMNTWFGLSFCSVSFLIADLFINTDLILNLDLTPRSWPQFIILTSSLSQSFTLTW